MAAKRIYGIDLGTTYSCISYIDDSGRPVVVPNAEGDNTTPSVVYFESPRNIVVGKEAKNQSKLSPDRVIAFVKREMGNATFSFEVDGKPYRPEEVSSFILRKLVRDAAQHTGEEVTDVVITCPAYFGINEREATKNAGEIAGLRVHHILNEPTAAAICYAAGKPEDKVVLVYDLGGGTFDVTVIAVSGGDIQVIYTDGNHNLGGKDWDDILISHLSDQFTKEHPDKGSPCDDPMSFQDLVLGAEELKRSLSSREKATCLVSHAGARTRVELTRPELEILTAARLGETLDLTRKVLEEAKARGYAKIDQLLLVGGSSRMPCVARRIEEELGLAASLFEPDLAVTKGAAWFGLKLVAGEMIREIIAERTGKRQDEIDVTKLDRRTLEEAANAAQKKARGALRLPGAQIADMARAKIINVCSRGIGVMVVAKGKPEEHEVAHLIRSNTAVPLSISEEGFGTVEPDQRSVKIRVMEAKATTESREVADNSELGVGVIEGLPPGLPEASPIHVTFQLAEDGTLDVAAREPSSRRELRMTIQTKAIMSQSEVASSRDALSRKTVS